MRGKLIAIEGLDGAGLTTQAVLLRNHLMQKYKVVLTREPTDGLIGGIIKSCLRREWKTDNQTLQTLFAADRSHHIATEIEPAMKEGKIVISDRYILSAIAYGMFGLPMSFLTQINSTFRKPDVTILLDTQQAVCLERIKKSRHHLELFEDEQKMAAIRKNFLAVKNYFPETYMIDGNSHFEGIHKEIRKIVMKGL